MKPLLVERSYSWKESYANLRRFCPAFFQPNIPSLNDAIANVKKIPARQGWALALRSKGMFPPLQYYHDRQS